MNVDHAMKLILNVNYAKMLTLSFLLQSILSVYLVKQHWVLQ